MRDFAEFTSALEEVFLRIEEAAAMVEEVKNSVSQSGELGELSREGKIQEEMHDLETMFHERLMMSEQSGEHLVEVRLSRQCMKVVLVGWRMPNYPIM